ncbi:hypothetical protein D3C80_1707070 [compost metagenome]
MGVLTGGLAIQRFRQPHHITDFVLMLQPGIGRIGGLGSDCAGVVGALVHHGLGGQRDHALGAFNGGRVVTAGGMFGDFGIHIGA